MSAPLARRAGLALLVLVLSALALDGLHGWVRGDSLVRRAWLGPVDRTRSDADRLEAAKRTPGPFALDVDPLVGLRMKADTTREILGVPATTVAFGERRRLGPPPVPGAAHVVVLGDSVAFGFGLADHETLAERIEHALAGALPAGSPRPWVSTVACPGWTGPNSIRYLLDHLERLRPDIVVAVPVSNDLDDPLGVDEAGHSSYAGQVGSTRPHMSVPGHVRFLSSLEHRAAPRDVARFAATGRPEALAHVLQSDLTPESVRRWDAWTAAWIDLEERLDRTGCRLAIALYRDDYFQRYLHARVAPVLRGALIVPGFRDFGAPDQLPGDPHPNAEYVDALATAVARDLVAAGWIEGATADALPELAPRWLERRAELLEPADLERWRAETHELQRAFLGPRIDLSVALGVHQIYAGVAGDGTVGTGLVAALAGKGPTLTLRGTRVDAPGLCPLRLTVSVDGEVCGVVELTGDDAPDFERHFALPGSALEAEIVDVAVQASTWVVRTSEGPRRRDATRLESFRFASLERH